MYVSIHPFPARMAPDVAVSRLDQLQPGSVVLDPMSGSGTVVRHAAELGLKAYGFDLDPLAVLISRVSSRRVADETIEAAGARLVGAARSLRSAPTIPWIDGDAEAERFVNYWFADKQRDDLRRVAQSLATANEIGISVEACDVLKVALSRIIVTKTQAASLAQDTSHSRPHRVATESDYDVLVGLERSIAALRRRLQKINPTIEAVVDHGDARNLATMEDESVDFVLTSPPYLNALDYMRGHRMSLIWLGHRYSELSKTRSTSIGTERAPDEPLPDGKFHEVLKRMGHLDKLPSRHRGMIDRYVADLHGMAREVARVLRRNATATFVMGDSCLKGIFVSNSGGLAAAAEMAGLKKIGRMVRDLPRQHRYLPTPNDGALGRRMRQEIILTFQKLGQ